MTYEKPLSEIVKPDWLSDEDWQRTLQKVESATVMRQDAKAHVKLYQDTNGQEGYELAGCPCLLLTTIGRKTGNPVTTALNFIEDSGGYIVVGSLGGTAEHPHWAKNLMQSPKAWAQIKDKKWEADVREVTGAERERLWPNLVKAMPLWGVFVQRTDRVFPIFIIRPRRPA